MAAALEGLKGAGEFTKPADAQGADAASGGAQMKTALDGLKGAGSFTKPAAPDEWVMTPGGGQRRGSQRELALAAFGRRESASFDGDEAKAEDAGGPRRPWR